MLFLTKAELVELTERKRKQAQIAVLRHMGIRHTVRPDGSILVARSHIDSVYGGKQTVRPTEEPNWAGIS
jgi:hypothetical protein